VWGQMKPNRGECVGWVEERNPTFAGSCVGRELRDLGVDMWIWGWGAMSGYALLKPDHDMLQVDPHRRLIDG
jgi:hypothetical protein